MSTTEFTDTEIETLRKGATGAGMLVAVSDRGFFDTFKEAGALAKHLSNAREKSDSALIRRLGEGRGTGFGITDSPAEIESETTEALRTGTQLLQTKAPEELEAYRSFVLDLARSVASAAGGGDEKETAAVEKVRSALGQEV
jgi:hypothetical protein